MGGRERTLMNPPPLFPEIPDRSLAQMRIPKTLLDEITAAGTFESSDFELDGVATVDEDGTHSKTPEPVRKGFELRQYGTATIGLRWRKVPVSENEEMRSKLDPKLLEKQLRMTKCAYNSFGNDPSFIVSDEDRMKRIAARRVKHHVSAEFMRRVKACSFLQATVRRHVLGPLYPWYYIARLASSALQTQLSIRKRPKNEASRTPTRKSQHQESDGGCDDLQLPEIPWCLCWIRLESVCGADGRLAVALEQLSRDFRAQQYETCLRRVDNIVFANSPRPAQSGRPPEARVLLELAALCNRFALHLFELGRAQLAHAFFSRVLTYTHMTSPGEFEGKHELFAWTCDLVAFCLWQQGKFEKAHYSLSRSAQHAVPPNAALVARLHSCQLLHRLGKHDLAIKLGASLLVDLLRVRSAHAAAAAPLAPDPAIAPALASAPAAALGAPGPIAPAGRGGSVSPGPGGGGGGRQLLRIVEGAEERGGQASAPLFLDLMCHAGLTLAMALHRKAAASLRAEPIASVDAAGTRRARAVAVDADGTGALLFRRAAAIAAAVGRQTAAEPSKVSPGLAECTVEYRALLEREAPRFAAAIGEAGLRQTRILCLWLGAARLRHAEGRAGSRMRPLPASWGGRGSGVADTLPAVSPMRRSAAREAALGRGGSGEGSPSGSPARRSVGFGGGFASPVALQASIASAGSLYEPGNDWGWASEFYGDVYWHRSPSGFDSALSDSF